MADKNVKDHRVVGQPFGNESIFVKVLYDFDEDTGESDDDYMLFTADGDLVITECYFRGITELDSAGDGASIDVGIDGGDEDVLFDGVAEATVAAGALVKTTIVEGAPNVLPLPLKLADGGKIRLKILGEDLTSGKCEFNFRVSKFGY